MMKSRHIRSHTALRGIAALLVVGYHLQFGAGPRLEFETATEFFRRGYLWVDLFFILSGFVISYTNLSGDGRGLPSSDVPRFIAARVARIYPLHFFCLSYLLLFNIVVTAMFLAVGRSSAMAMWSDEALLQLVLQFALLHAWGFISDIGWNIPSWSISAELFAYLLFPLFALALARGAGMRVMMVAAAIGFYVAIGLSTGNLDIITGLALARGVAGFILGMILFVERDRFERLSDRALTTMQVVAGIGILYGLAQPLNDTLLIPCFLVFVASTWPDRGFVARALSARPLMRLGEISYSIYLNHVCVIAILGFVWARVAPRLAWPESIERSIYIGLIVGATLLVSSLTYRFVEVPGRAWLLHRLRASARAPVEVPTVP